jgi:hypothetical protein
MHHILSNTNQSGVMTHLTATIMTEVTMPEATMREEEIMAMLETVIRGHTIEEKDRMVLIVMRNSIDP